MSKRLYVLLGIFILAAAYAVAQPKSDGRTIQVDVSYTGSGTVDSSRKIYVALWDSVAPDGPPVAVKPIDSKTGTVTFTDVQTVPAYVSVAYDPTGKWEGRSQPPSGCSLGTYSKAPPTPEPINITPGETAKIKITFDDTKKVS